MFMEGEGMGARDAKPVHTQGRDGCRDTKFKVLIHKKFWPYGCEGPFKPHVVGIACLEHRLPHNTAGTDKSNKGEG